MSGTGFGKLYCSAVRAVLAEYSMISSCGGLAYPSMVPTLAAMPNKVDPGLFLAESGCTSAARSSRFAGLAMIPVVLVVEL